MNITALLFKTARKSNALRHIRKGTIAQHLFRKFVINKVLRRLGI